MNTFSESMTQEEAKTAFDKLVESRPPVCLPGGAIAGYSFDYDALKELEAIVLRVPVELIED